MHKAFSAVVLVDVGVEVVSGSMLRLCAWRVRSFFQLIPMASQNCLYARRLECNATIVTQKELISHFK